MSKTENIISKLTATEIFFKFIIFSIIVVFLIGLFTPNLYSFQSSGKEYSGGVISCLMNDPKCFSILNLDIINKTIYGWILGLSLASVLFLVLVFFGITSYVGILAASILMAIVVYLCICIITLSEMDSTLPDINTIVSIVSYLKSISSVVDNLKKQTEPFINQIEISQQQDLPQYQTTIIQNQTDVDAILQNPDAIAILQNPAAIAVLQNPTSLTALQNPTIVEALQNPLILTALQNPALFQNININEANDLFNTLSNISLTYPSISWYKSYSLILIISAFITLLIVLIIMSIYKISKIYKK